MRTTAGEILVWNRACNQIKIDIAAVMTVSNETNKWTIRIETLFGICEGTIPIPTRMGGIILQIEIGKIVMQIVIQTETDEAKMDNVVIRTKRRDVLLAVILGILLRPRPKEEPATVLQGE